MWQLAKTLMSFMVSEPAKAALVVLMILTLFVVGAGFYYIVSIQPEQQRQTREDYQKYQETTSAAMQTLVISFAAQSKEQRTDFIATLREIKADSERQRRQDAAALREAINELKQAMIRLKDSAFDMREENNDLRALAAPGA